MTETIGWVFLFMEGIFSFGDGKEGRRTSRRFTAGAISFGIEGLLLFFFFQGKLLDKPFPMDD
jgi:hypothetical protein